MREDEELGGEEPDGDDESIRHEVEQPAVEAHVPLEHVHAAELQRCGAESASERCPELFSRGDLQATSTKTKHDADAGGREEYAKELAKHFDFFLV